MRILPRIPLYSAAVAMATAGTVLLATTPAQAQDWTIDRVPADKTFDCVPVSAEGKELNQKAWPKKFIGLDEAHQFNRGTFEETGDPVIIAVIDSGVAGSREDVFEDRLLDGFDAWQEETLGHCDSSMHGTAVAAIAAGAQLDEDFVGVAPEAAILPIRIYLGGDNDKDADSLEKSGLLGKAIRDAVAHDADVINISATAMASDELEAAVQFATENNVVIVAATGNKSINMDDEVNIPPEDWSYYPANYPEVIAVGAHDELGGWYQGTNFGENLDLLAPGVNVAFPYAGGKWQTSQGTSFAAPFVAGAAALLKGEFGKEATPAWIQRRLQETAIHPSINKNIYQGWGILNVAAALTAPGVGDPFDPDVEPLVVEAPTDFMVPEDELGEIAPLNVGYDPLAFEKTIAWASVGASLLLVTLVLVLRKIIPKGRKRGWRPGTRKPDNLPAKLASD